MPRRPRVRLRGQPRHIVLRGHNREACFSAEEDFHTFLHWLGESLNTFSITMHAYVQMTNHVHLLLTPMRAEDVPSLMILLGRRYVQYVNKTYHRTGALSDIAPTALPSPRAAYDASPACVVVAISLS